MQGKKVSSRCKHSTMMVVIIIVMHVPGFILSKHFTWFKAQEKCRDLNESLTLNETQPGKPYWTGYYKRQSRWIKIIGCYNESDVRISDYQQYSLTSSSPGLCQELCLVQNWSLFAIQAKLCICLPHALDVLPLIPNMCNYTCDNSLLLASECGGESSFNVFESENYTQNVQSKTWRMKMLECQSFGAYLLGNLSLLSAALACMSVNEAFSGPRWIGVVRYTYESTDRAVTELVKTGIYIS
ncbi:uncharacterized protein LOC133195129 [Saccostrea echinata]|uniref:uncharacterized protein LOC133195129 n=1 Tax=Saccostrea echinata TaxID=191078 RepID=UPI002A8288E9|nr:uncharacterized protein LOC133195129 [Saccostrea echinata]